MPAQAQFNTIAKTPERYKVEALQEGMKKPEPTPESMAPVQETSTKPADESKKLWIDRYLSVSYPLQRIRITSPYGYRKDPADKNKLIVEPQAAAVVRRIYALYLAGHGTQGIAAILNRDGVPNPTRHKQAMGYPYRNGAAHNDHGLWNRTTVSRILRDQMYTGDLVQGRTKKISYKSKKMASVPQRDWIIVPDSHEPVISRRTFERVQEMLHARTRSTGLGEVHPLAGKVHCMQCGSAMQR